MIENELQQASVFRWLIKAIVFTIHVFNRAGEFIWINIVERGHRNEVEPPSLRTVVTAADRANAAGATELKVKVGARMSWRRPFIFGLHLGTLD